MLIRVDSIECTLHNHDQPCIPEEHDKIAGL